MGSIHYFAAVQQFIILNEFSQVECLALELYTQWLAMSSESVSVAMVGPVLRTIAEPTHMGNALGHLLPVGISQKYVGSFFLLFLCRIIQLYLIIKYHIQGRK
jgi:hypothetical protein